jgi:hypothetical protein
VHHTLVHEEIKNQYEDPRSRNNNLFNEEEQALQKSAQDQRLSMDNPVV